MQKYWSQPTPAGAPGDHDRDQQRCRTTRITHVWRIAAREKTCGIIIAIVNLTSRLWGMHLQSFSTRYLGIGELLSVYTINGNPRFHSRMG